MGNYLGLDLSLTHTGFYLIKEGGADEYCEIKTKPDGWDNDIQRVDYIAKQILDKIRDTTIDFIAMEDYFSGQQAGSVIKLAILGTVVRTRLLDNKYSYIALVSSRYLDITVLN